MPARVVRMTYYKASPHLPKNMNGASLVVRRSALNGSSAD